MKKFLTIICILFISTFTLSSCNMFNGDVNPNVNNIITDDTLVTTVQSQITKTFEKVEPACVGIEATGGNSTSIGSGVIYKLIDAKTNDNINEKTTDLSAYVVTNNHVVSEKNSFRVYVDQTKSYVADLIGTDAKNDLAVLKFNCKYVKDELSFVDILGTEMISPTKGSLAIAVGCPLSLSNFNFPTLGLISKSTANEIVHSVAINPGNSGGGLFDAVTGALIGINVSKRVYQTQTDSNGHQTQIPVDSIGMAIPVWLVKKVILDIEASNTDIKRPLLGVTVALIVAQADKNNGDQLPPESNSGVVIIGVEDKSNASHAQCTNNALQGKGLKIGDVITKIDTKKVERLDDLSYVLATSKVGSTISMSVKRKIDGSWRDLEFLIKLL